MRRAICLSGANRYTSCVTAVLIGVIYAISYVTLNAFNMLGGITFTFIVKLFVFHFDSLFST
jgi:hypothetical protein